MQNDVNYSVGPTLPIKKFINDYLTSAKHRQTIKKRAELVFLIKRLTWGSRSEIPSGRWL